ncbi:putative lipoprotein [Leptospira fainei serovar Hurstbridge str. BUT 6]|uniref:Lipoprotein n=1 Tax=Leptospira fainei serovar Hurstbridge str. BUT 6 TaxID=1193011 RepID=S3V3K1_9LEPT|nr:lipoprotein LipL46 [Leptospira fainei]EPG75224.1 putative lipoprotein [Leptospira fainei serovar Hurstbridge str. BUT 6]
MAKLPILRISALTLVLAFAFACATGSASGRKKKEYYEKNGDQITVIGEAPIYNGDKANAKQRALKDAKINAVRKVVGEQITNKSQASDGESLGSSLLSKTDAFVKSYDIVDEAEGKIDTQPILKLTVRCTVEESKISTAVDSLLADVGNPRVIIVIPSTVAGQAVPPLTPNNIAEAEIAKNLKKAGNKVVDAATAAKTVNKSQVDPTNVDAGSPIVAQAQASGAEVMIIGNVETEDQPVLTSIGGKSLDRPLYNTAATGAYKVILLWGDGKIVDSGTGDGRAADITQKVSREKAIAQWAESVAKKVNKQLKEEWFNLTENNTIILKFTGLNADESTKFKDDLTEFTAAKDINVRTSDSNGSEWEVTYPGKDALFVDELVYKKDRGFTFLATKNLTVKSATRGVVTLEFKANK